MEELTIEQKLKREQALAFKGVNYDHRIDKFTAKTMLEGQRKWLGTFDTAMEAHVAYENAKQEAKMRKADGRRQPSRGPQGTTTRKAMTHEQARAAGLSFRPAVRSKLTAAEKVQLRQEMGYGPDSVHGERYVQAFNEFLQAESIRTGKTIGPLLDELWGARDFV